MMGNEIVLAVKTIGPSWGEGGGGGEVIDYVRRILFSTFTI